MFFTGFCNALNSQPGHLFRQGGASVPQCPEVGGTCQLAAP